MLVPSSDQSMTLAALVQLRTNQNPCFSMTLTASFSLFDLQFEQCRHNTERSTMASTRSLMRISSRPLSSPVACALRSRTPYPAATFSTSAFRSATPAGPPPAGFRLPRKERWDDSKENTLDKAGKYFLLIEMMRGMYVVLEQFFRPP